MSTLLRITEDLYCSASAWLDRSCQANPKYISNPAEQEVANTRNKTIFIIHTILLILYTSDIFISGAPVVVCLFRAALTIGILTSLILSCRYHPEIFGVTYAIICITYGPGIIDSGSEGIHSAWVAASLLPMFQFLFTGSFKHFMVQSVFQFFYLNVLYPPRMEKAVVTMTPEYYTLTLKHAFSLVFVVQGLIMVSIHHSMTQALNRVRIIEKKSAEIENQKNFLLSFSHELRNLINSLAGNVKLASLETNISIRTKELLLNAEVCGELLLHLVNNILDTGKVEIGELEINPTPTKIYNSLEKIWGICSELICYKDLKGSMKIQKDIPRTILTDNYRLTQVFLNLVGNALKFTERGSINVCVEWEAEKREVTESCFQPYPFNEDDDQDEGLFEKSQGFSILHQKFTTLDTKNRKLNVKNLTGPDTSRTGVLKITITDTGCGMTKSELAQLFQKFTQLSSDPSIRKLGTGLGLFISKQICTRSDGDIRVFSKKGTGSCFIFCLPVETIDNQNEVPTDIDSLKNIIKDKKLRAMIVDDIPFNHHILINYFNKLGIEVADIAVNGAEAYEKYLALSRTGNRPHIVAMDIDMPVMNGKVASKMIREFEMREGLTPCFLGIVSGNCTDSETRECLDKHGSIKADSFIKKPANLEELLRTLGYHFIRD